MISVEDVQDQEYTRYGTPFEDTEEAQDALESLDDDVDAILAQTDDGEYQIMVKESVRSSGRVIEAMARKYTTRTN